MKEQDLTLVGLTEDKQKLVLVNQAGEEFTLPDEARWLVGEQSASRGPQPRTGSGPRRLSAVGADDELPLGEDAIGMVSEEHAAEEATEDLSATAAAVRAHERSTGP